MGRELQKRKRRSSRAVVRQPSSKSKRLMFPLGNSIVAQNWDKTQTASQNYKRLGLVSRLKAPTGGVEPDRKAKQSGLVSESTATTSPLTLAKSAAAAAAKSSKSGGDPFSIALATDAIIGEVRVERDASGKIIRILDETTTMTTTTGPKKGSSRPNPLNDPLNALDSDDSDGDEEEEEAAEEWGGIDEAELPEGNIIKQLEEEANRPQVKVPRGQSAREREWLEGLVARHGSNLAAMARDRRLNPMQQTAADIGRRIKKWRKEGADF
ncbi:Ribosome biogenesis protein Nop16 [Microdochium nivale]|nr:Ribosome biogenesis protein Nop16 [Microdochium nivale]